MLLLALTAIGLALVVGGRLTTGGGGFSELHRIDALVVGPEVGPATEPFSFQRTYVDLAYGGDGKPGWVRAGDMDGDGQLEIVAGGGRALFVYERGAGDAWQRFGSLDGTGEMGANGGVLFDVDGDSDLDVVSALYRSDLGWWENPGGPLSNELWSFHELGDESWFLHDIVRVDLDGDGAQREFVANLFTHGPNGDVRVDVYVPGPDPREPWERTVIERGRDDGENDHAGLDAGDVDRDGRTDLAYSNGWYEAPQRPGGAWLWHPVTGTYGISNALLRDMDGDGDLDLVMSAGHHGSGVYWFANPAADPETRPWVQHVVDGDLVHPECLAVLDLDADDDLDIVTCDLDFDRWDQEVDSIYLFENAGNSEAWTRRALFPGSYASHLLQTVDLDGDARTDILSEATGFSVVSYYRNTSAVPSCIDERDCGGGILPRAP
jgi:hypothetical protein